MERSGQVRQRVFILRVEAQTDTLQVPVAMTVPGSTIYVLTYLAIGDQYISLFTRF
jgi:hypothetical protein